MSRLRVLHCLETVGSGGVEQRRLTLARQLNKDKYEQELLCTQAIGALPAKFALAGCPIHEIGVFRGILDFERYRSALAVVRKFKPHIIHGAVYEGVAVAAMVGRWAGVPVIISEETSDPVGRRWQGHLLYRGLTSLTHNTVAVSKAVQDYLINGIKLPQSKVTLIINGVAEPIPVFEDRVKVEDKRKSIRDTLGIRESDFIIGTCGRLLDEHKRFSDLIQSLKYLLKQAPNVKLLIVGEGPDEGKLRAFADQLGVAENVLFAGYQGDTRPFYEIMDVFALASAHEAFGLVLVEAMFEGLSIVATRVGGIPMVVKDGISGYLVEPKNIVALTDRLLVLINNAALRESMGQEGLALARAEFSTDRYVSQVDNLYQRLVAQRIKQ